MLRSLRTAERAMQLQQMRMETLANNLANVSATGFKQLLTRIEEDSQKLASADTKAAAESAAPVTAPAAGESAASRSRQPAADVRLRRALDVRPGLLRQTGRHTDLAIMGEGFFVVSTPEGDRYTRDGTFRLDDQRRLQTASGQLVAGRGGPLTLDGKTFSVGQDGSVSVDGSVVGDLKVVRFVDPTRLQPIGSGLLRAPADLEPEDMAKTELHVEQGHLEDSNVNPIDTLVSMIAAQRAFEIEAKIIQSNDDTLERSVNELGRTR